MKNNTEKIGRYLQNEMSAEERTAFEKQLAGDRDLQQELVIQKQILAAVEKAGLKKFIWQSDPYKIHQPDVDSLGNCSDCWCGSCLLCI